MIRFDEGTADDADTIAALRNEVARDMTARYGKGHWSLGVTKKGVLFGMTRSRVFLARQTGRIVAMLALSTRKPWAIDKTYFVDCKHPLYLTSLVVTPDLNGKGIGRLCVDEAVRIATAWPADAIRLDAYDGPMGAGDFYAKCNFREVGRLSYRNTPLIYFEMLLR